MPNNVYFLISVVEQNLVEVDAIAVDVTLSTYRHVIKVVHHPAVPIQVALRRNNDHIYIFKIGV